MKPLGPLKPPALKPSAPGIKPKKPTLPTPLGSKLSGAVSDALHRVENLLKPGETIEDFAAALQARSEQEMSNLRAWSDLGTQLCRDLGNGNRVRSFVEDVLKPMEKRQLDSRSAVARTNGIFGRDVSASARAKSPFGGGVTIAVNVGPAIGAGIGWEKCYGLAMNAFAGAPRAFECWSRTLHAGTVELSVSASVEFSLGAPEQRQPAFLANSPFASKAAGWDGWGLGWAFGGGWGATLSVAVGFTPEFTKPVSTWKFKGFAVQVGGGGGADLGLWLQGAAARELPPPRLPKK